jgi:hypothetical protein
MPRGMKVLSLKAIKLIFKVVAALCLIGVAAGAVALIVYWPALQGSTQYPSSQYSALIAEDQKILAESEKPEWSPSPSPTIESVPVKRAVLVNPYPTRDITDQIRPRLTPRQGSYRESQ